MSERPDLEGNITPLFRGDIPSSSITLCEVAHSVAGDDGRAAAILNIIFTNVHECADLKHIQTVAHLENALLHMNERGGPTNRKNELHQLEAVVFLYNLDIRGSQVVTVSHLASLVMGIHAYHRAESVYQANVLGSCMRNKKFKAKLEEKIRSVSQTPYNQDPLKRGRDFTVPRIYPIRTP